MLLDVTRLLRDPKVSAAILATRGDVFYRQILDAVQDIAIGAAASSRADSAAAYLRTGTQVALLGWNLWTAAQQPLGLFNGMRRVGPTWVARGMKRWLRDAASMESTTKWIAEVSPFMRHRSDTATQDLAQVRTALRQPGGWFDDLVRTVTLDTVTQQHLVDSYMWHIGLMQRVADVPTWLGAYEKAMSETAGDEARAIAMADQAVIDSQGSGLLKDLSQKQRGGDVAKLFMTFYSYGATVFNETYAAAGEARSKEHTPAQLTALLGHYSLLYLAPAMATVALANAFGRRDDDDAGEWVSAIGGEMLSTALNTMVYVRELSGLASDGVRGYAGPAGTRTFVTLFRAGQQLKQGEVDEALVKALNQAAGTLFRYPAAQVERTVDGYLALRDGTTHNPAALLFGPPRED